MMTTTSKCFWFFLIFLFPSCVIVLQKPHLQQPSPRIFESRTKNGLSSAIPSLDLLEVESSNRHQLTKNDTLMPFPHFCTTPGFDFVIYPNKSAFTRVEYQCAGEEYEMFGKKMYQFAIDQKNNIAREKDVNQQESVAKKNLTRTPSSNWGQYTYPLPANAFVLVIGNSHGRQVLKAIECQFAHQIESIEWKKWLTQVVRFKNGSILVAVLNSPLVFSRLWQDLLENDVLVTHTSEQPSGTKVPINTLDAFVLGDLNLKETTLNTNYAASMANYSRMFPDHIQFETTTPLSIHRIAQAYRGELIYMSMFSVVRSQRNSIIPAMNEKYSNRSTFLDGRKYVELLRHECASNLTVDHTQQGLCLPQLFNGHRCTGLLGGHPDLIAFDLVDIFHRIIAEK